MDDDFEEEIQYEEPEERPLDEPQALEDVARLQEFLASSFQVPEVYQHFDGGDAVFSIPLSARRIILTVTRYALTEYGSESIAAFLALPENRSRLRSADGHRFTIDGPGFRLTDDERLQ